MKTLLEFLFAFLRPGVEGPDDESDDTPPEENEDPEPQLELDVDPAAPIEEPEAADPKKALTSAQETAKAERERADRYERELADARRSQESRVAARPQEDPIEREENSRLADPKTSELEKWQINANRELRRGRNDSQMALAQAHDVADKTTFANLAVTSPALYKRYAARVEEALASMRSRGFNAPRETILDNMIGKDAREGKLTRKAAPKEKPAADTVTRGKLPGVRSDVAGRGKMTEHQKREQRLLNVAI